MQDIIYDKDIQIYFLKMLYIVVCSYFTFIKITNSKIDSNKKRIIGMIIIIIEVLIISITKNITNTEIRIISLIILLSLINADTTSKNITYSFMVSIIVITFNYILFFISAFFAFIICKIINLQNDFIVLMVICLIHLVFLIKILNINKLKYGISFLQKNMKNEYLDMFILNISVIIIFSIIIFVNVNILNTVNIAIGIVTLAVVMFITIQKSIQLSYKQKLLEQELKITKEKLEDKTKELEEAEKENIKISKKNHTITHKQKSLNYKIEEIIGKIENGQEIGIDIKETKRRIEKLSKEINEEKVETELNKTEILEIDDMLKYMQSESRKNNIDFELQIKGNINYMVNNLIDKEDLETLIADHVKNAIIAINHTENINRSILVKLGKIEEIYSLYIYDSGIEFKKETLETLGKKPSTTYKDEGGTGMGFMNTFDTLKKYKASLTIKQNGKPSKDNYTKAIIIKFDNKNEYTIK